jgi:hypothetical protein
MFSASFYYYTGGMFLSCVDNEFCEKKQSPQNNSAMEGVLSGDN